MERNKNQSPRNNMRLGILSSINSDIPKPKLSDSVLRSITSEADELVSPLQKRLRSVNPNDLEDSASKIASIVKKKREASGKKESIRESKLRHRDYEPEINETERYRILNAMAELKKANPHINIPNNVQDVRILREIYEGTREQLQISNKLMIMRLGILGFFVVSQYLGKKFIGNHMENLVAIETILWPIYDKILLEIEDDPLTFPTIKVNMSPMTKLMVIMLGSTIIFALLGSLTNEKTIEGIFSMLGNSVSNAKVDTNEIIPNIISGGLNKLGLGNIFTLMTGKKPTGEEEMKNLDSVMSDISIAE